MVIFRLCALVSGCSHRGFFKWLTWNQPEWLLRPNLSKSTNAPHKIAWMLQWYRRISLLCILTICCLTRVSFLLSMAYYSFTQHSFVDLTYSWRRWCCVASVRHLRLSHWSDVTDGGGAKHEHRHASLRAGQETVGAALSGKTYYIYRQDFNLVREWADDSIVVTSEADVR